ncbi:MAG: hypothetical protein P8182_09870, partial [Deltaproteobacteria bacterium]
ALTEILGALRKHVLRDGSSPDENREIFFRVVDSELVSALRERDEAKALTILKSLLPGCIDPEPAVRKALAGLAGEE